MSLKYAQCNTLYQAGSGVIIGATSIILTTLTDIYANVLTMADFGAKGYGSCEPDSTNEESFTFTGITANANGTYTLTGVSSALAKSPYTETSGLVRAHSGGTKVVISDTTAFWNTFGQTKNTNTWDSVQTFSALPTIPLTPSASTDAASKGYVDTVAVAGAPNASTTVKGIVQEATQAQILSKTAAGSTGAELYVNPSTLPSTLTSDYKVDTGSANAYVITPAPAITAYTTGQIFSFKAVNANTTASTLNVNGLGTKAIVNSKGGALVSGDISASMMVTVEYDGTSMVMQNPVANAPTVAPLSYSSDIQIFTSTGANTWTKPTSLTPKKIFIQLWAGGASGGKGNFNNAGGGGGGEYVERWIDASAAGSTETVTIGAGGAAKAVAGIGNIGGNTTFGSLSTAHGGAAGPGVGGVASAGGSGGNPFTTLTPLWGAGVSGAAGQDGIYSAAGGGQDGTSGVFAGGNSIYGGAGGGGQAGASSGSGGTSTYGGNGGAGAQNGNATAGSTPSGGGGANAGTGSSGKGGDGKAIITTFF